MELPDFEDLQQRASHFGLRLTRDDQSYFLAAKDMRKPYSKNVEYYATATQDLNNILREIETLEAERDCTNNEFVREDD